MLQSEWVVDEYYEEYVMPFFKEDSDAGDYTGDGINLGCLGIESDANWEDISDDELDSLARENADLAFHMMIAGAFGQHMGMGYYDNVEDDDMFDDTFDDPDYMYDDMSDTDMVAYGADLGIEPSAWMIGPVLLATVTEQTDVDSDDEMPELVS
jgi:hypothetical protein